MAGLTTQLAVGLTCLTRPHHDLTAGDGTSAARNRERVPCHPIHMARRMMRVAAVAALLMASAGAIAAEQATLAADLTVQVNVVRGCALSAVPRSGHQSLGRRPVTEIDVFGHTFTVVCSQGPKGLRPRVDTQPVPAPLPAANGAGVRDVPREAPVVVVNF
jgi:hypothetical protein